MSVFVFRVNRQHHPSQFTNLLPVVFSHRCFRLVEQFVYPPLHTFAWHGRDDTAHRRSCCYRRVDSRKRRGRYDVEIPRTVDDITPEWLTKVLCGSYAINEMPE